MCRLTKEIVMSDVNKQLLEAVKHCHGIFDQYVSHHLAKPDYDKAAANERHRAICAEAIAAAEQAQAEPVAWDSIEAVAAGRYKVVPSHESMFYRFAVVAGDGEQQLYLGRKVECENMARSFAGAFLDGAFAYQQITEPAQPPAVADRDAIRRIFMAHGFTIKEGQADLKPYVYEAAEALLRELSPAVAVPDGYVLTKIPHEYAKTLVNGGWNQYADGWNACRAAMLAAAQKGGAQ